MTETESAIEWLKELPCGHDFLAQIWWYRNPTEFMRCRIVHFFGGFPMEVETISREQLRQILLTAREQGRYLSCNHPGGGWDTSANRSYRVMTIGVTREEQIRITRIDLPQTESKPIASFDFSDLDE